MYLKSSEGGDNVVVLDSNDLPENWKDMITEMMNPEAVRNDDRTDIDWESVEPTLYNHEEKLDRFELTLAGIPDDIYENVTTILTQVF